MFIPSKKVFRDPSANVGIDRTVSTKESGKHHTAATRQSHTLNDHRSYVLRTVCTCLLSFTLLTMKFTTVVSVVLAVVIGNSLGVVAHAGTPSIFPPGYACPLSAKLAFLNTVTPTTTSPVSIPLSTTAPIATSTAGESTPTVPPPPSIIVSAPTPIESTGTTIPLAPTVSAPSSGTTSAVTTSSALSSAATSSGAPQSSAAATGAAQASLRMHEWAIGACVGALAVVM